MNSFIKRIGGKKQLREKIVQRFPEKFNAYVEVFGGAGWVLFYRDKHANKEVYNDIDSNLVNLFRCVKYHPEELKKQLNYTLISRENFLLSRERMKEAGYTDIQCAAMFYELVKNAYGSGNSFGCNSTNIVSNIDLFDDVHKRLSRVVIEHKNFDDLIKTYDRSDTLFYLDPPYYGTEHYYSGEFGEADHIALRDILKCIKGKFLLSYNDHPYIRELYKGFEIEEVERYNNLKSKYSESENTGYRELIIKNY